MVIMQRLCPLWINLILIFTSRFEHSVIQFSARELEQKKVSEGSQGPLVWIYLFIRNSRENVYLTF